MELLPGSQPRTPALCHARETSPPARCRAVCDHELNLGVRPRGGAVVAAFPSGVDRAHEVQVRGYGYCSRPTAWRASFLVPKMLTRTTLPSWRVHTVATTRSTDAPLARPRASHRPTVTTDSP